MDSAAELGRFRRLVTATIVATFVLILIGGIVRVSDSGLGCGPEGSGTHGWPLCEGGVIPANSAESMIEYSHRIAAGIVSVLMLMVAWRAWRRLREYRWIVGLSAAAGVLVLAQAGLGGLTVEEGLHEYLVAAHLGLAMIFLGTLFALRRLASEPEPKPASGSGLLRSLSVVTAVLVLATIVAGGLGRGHRGRGHAHRAGPGRAHGLRRAVPRLRRSVHAVRNRPPHRHPARPPPLHVPDGARRARARRRRDPPAGAEPVVRRRRRPGGGADPPGRGQRLARQARRPDRRAPEPGHRDLGDDRLREHHPDANPRPTLGARHRAWHRGLADALQTEPAPV